MSINVLFRPYGAIEIWDEFQIELYARPSDNPAHKDGVGIGIYVNTCGLECDYIEFEAGGSGLLIELTPEEDEELRWYRFEMNCLLDPDLFWREGNKLVLHTVEGVIRVIDLPCVHIEKK